MGNPDDIGAEIIDAERSYRQGSVYGSAVPTAVLRATGFVTHMDTLRLETPALGRMAYLQAVADQHHELSRQPSPQRSLFTEDTLLTGDLFTGDGAPPSNELSSTAPTGGPTVNSAYQYTNSYSGREHIVRREAGSVVKSIQGVAEDLYRRIHKRLPPAQDPLEDPEFRSFYDRVRRAMQRAARTDRAKDTSDRSLTASEGTVADIPSPTHSAHIRPSEKPDDRIGRPKDQPSPLVCHLGPAVPSQNKLVRDRNGQRWRASPALQSTPPAKAAQTTRAVRSSGPAPTVPWHRPYLDPMQVAEALYAHRETLHERFTHGWKATIQKRQWTRHQPRHARRSETSIATQGSDRPSFISVGRWREDEIDRRHPDSAVTVPWIIADIDGTSPATSIKHAKTLCRLLVKAGLDPAHLVVSYTGGRGCHVRIPHGAVGCPIYQNTEAASTLLIQFFDYLCTDHPGLRTAIDDTACRPTQMIRMIGSDRSHGGRCVAVTGDAFLELNPLVLFGHSDNNRYDGFTLPKPEEVPYAPRLRYLLLPRDSTTKHHPIHRPVTQLLQGSTSPHKLRLRKSADTRKKERASSAIHVNQYCWKPYFSRPPPTRELQPNQPIDDRLRVISRLMDPVREAEAWGEAAGRPYVGRNKACFIMGLYAYTYPEAALQRVQTLLTGRDGETMPEGDGAAPKSRRTSRWMQQITQAGAPDHERADVPGGDVPASDVPVETIVHAWNRLACRPALPEREVEATLQSARSYTQSTRR
jgi:hypothetical protein